MSKERPQLEISQWLQMLKEPWKSRAIKAASYVDGGMMTGLKGKATSFHEALSDAFWWHTEGFPYHGKEKEWERIYKSPKKYVQPKYHHFLK